MVEVATKVNEAAPKARILEAIEQVATPIEDVFWPPIIVSKEEIDAEIERLSSIPRPADGRRHALIVHPYAEEPGLGLAPGTQVRLEVLLPGERTKPIRHNSSQVNFPIEGSGFSVIDQRRIDFERYDTYVIPSLATYYHVNETDRRQVRLSYSNAPVLEKLKVHFVDEDPPEEPAYAPRRDEALAEHPIAHIFPLAAGREEQLMSYEKLINPDVIPQEPMHWPWALVKPELDKLVALGPSYKGRRLYLLYNPATGRTNGTTNSFFATITIRPPNINDRPHRHASSAINYFFAGSGWSRVAGKRYEWKAGDLMLTAPGWAIHAHNSNDEPVYELTIQDSPFHIALDSLMWQEDLKLPPRLLGSQYGFDTNRVAVS